MRNELEDLSFRILQPEQHAAIVERLEQLQAENRETIDTITRELTERLGAEGIKARVKARGKSPYSHFSKIERKYIALEQLSDMIGFRVIVESGEQIYRTVGLTIVIWTVVSCRLTAN